MHDICSKQLYTYTTRTVFAKNNKYNIALNGNFTAEEHYTFYYIIICKI